jgi:hypothetical protein
MLQTTTLVECLPYPETDNGIYRIVDTKYLATRDFPEDMKLPLDGIERQLRDQTLPLLSMYGSLTTQHLLTLA